MLCISFSNIQAMKRTKPRKEVVYHCPTDCSRREAIEEERPMELPFKKLTPAERLEMDRQMQKEQEEWFYSQPFHKQELAEAKKDPKKYLEDLNYIEKFEAGIAKQEGESQQQYENRIMRRQKGEIRQDHIKRFNIFLSLKNIVPLRPQESRAEFFKRVREKLNSL